eukprot:symbB.v1.2.003600.t1/scaffold202.1/size271277/11
MAPEVILGKGYTTAADLWSLGVCLFDFMVGSFPFGDDQASNAEIFKAVLKAPLKFPKWLGVHEKDAKELMKALLHRDPAKRLGAGHKGYEELKDHPFYSGFSWEDLLARQLEPPFRPKGETYAEDAEGGKDAEPGSLTVTEEDRQGDDDWIDPDPSWADERFSSKLQASFHQQPRSNRIEKRPDGFQAFCIPWQICGTGLATGNSQPESGKVTRPLAQSHPTHWTVVSVLPVGRSVWVNWHNCTAVQIGFKMKV